MTARVALLHGRGLEAKDFRQRGSRVECDKCGDIGWWRLADPFFPGIRLGSIGGRYVCALFRADKALQCIEPQRRQKQIHAHDGWC